MEVTAILHGKPERNYELRDYLCRAGIKVKCHCSNGPVLHLDNHLRPSMPPHEFQHLIQTLLKREDWNRCYLDGKGHEIKPIDPRCEVSHAELIHHRTGITLSVRAFCHDDDYRTAWTLINILVFMILLFMLIWAIMRTREIF